MAIGFLHRLHPAAALSPGAVRPDLAPRYAVVSARPSQNGQPAVEAPVPPVPPSPPLSRAVRPATASRAAADRLPPGPDEPRPAVAPPVVPASAPAIAPGQPPPPPAPAVQRTVQGESRGLHPSAAPGPALQPLPLPPLLAAAPEPVRPPAKPVLAPLRPPVVARAAVQSPPARPVVQVTIDRLDVHVPAEPAAATAPAPRRARPSGPSLADYLRAPPHGGRS